MVVAVIGTAGHALVHNLPAGRHVQAQGQVLKVPAGLLGLHLDAGGEAGALLEGRRIHRGAIGIHITHLDAQAIAARRLGLTRDRSYRDVYRAFAIVGEDAIFQHGFGFPVGRLLEQAGQGHGGKGRFLRREPGIRRKILRQGHGLSHAVAQHQGFQCGKAVAGGTAVGEVVRAVFREIASYAIEEGICCGSLAA